MYAVNNLNFKYNINFTKTHICQTFRIDNEIKQDNSDMHDKERVKKEQLKKAYLTEET